MKLPYTHTATAYVLNDGYLGDETGRNISTLPQTKLEKKTIQQKHLE